MTTVLHSKTEHRTTGNRRQAYGMFVSVSYSASTNHLNSRNKLTVYNSLLPAHLILLSFMAISLSNTSKQHDISSSTGLTQMSLRPIYILPSTSPTSRQASLDYSRVVLPSTNQATGAEAVALLIVLECCCSLACFLQTLHLPSSPPLPHSSWRTYIYTEADQHYQDASHGP